MCNILNCCYSFLLLRSKYLPKQFVFRNLHFKHFQKITMTVADFGCVMPDCTYFQTSFFARSFCIIQGTYYFLVSSNISTNK
jgi:hypothetical protein